MAEEEEMSTPLKDWRYRWESRLCAELLTYELLPRLALRHADAVCILQAIPAAPVGWRIGCTAGILQVRLMCRS